MATITLTALLQQEEDVYVATCPEVGTVSQGGTIEEALVNLREATELYLEEFPLSRVCRSTASRTGGWHIAWHTAASRCDA